MSPLEIPAGGSLHPLGACPCFIDITRPIRPGMAVWPGDPPVEFTDAASIARGDAVNVTGLAMGSHTGTHIDAPRHLLERGLPVDKIPLDSLIGPCQVALVRGRHVILAADLETLALPLDTTRLLLKTEGDTPGGLPAVLSHDAAEWIVRRGIALVGTESLSVEEAGLDGGLPVHRTLLSAGVIILEGLDLSAASPGPYSLICLPMYLEGGDGAPARAILCAIETDQ